jgi:hypothetical protein
MAFPTAREDLEPEKAKGALARGGAPGDPDRRERNGDAEHIGEDMTGVREEREAIGQQPANDLDQEDRDGQPEDRNQPGAMAGGGRRSMGHQATVSATCVEASTTSRRT